VSSISDSSGGWALERNAVRQHPIKTDNSEQYLIAPVVWVQSMK
jgi:hypothetical protein